MADVWRRLARLTTKRGIEAMREIYIIIFPTASVLRMHDVYVIFSLYIAVHVKWVEVGWRSWSGEVRRTRALIRINQCAPEEFFIEFG